MIRLENIRLYTGEAAFENGCVVVDGDRILYAGNGTDARPAATIPSTAAAGSSCRGCTTPTATRQ